jgi:bacterioferritin (cytochrome b1)
LVLSKPIIARTLNKQLNASVGEITQYFHSSYYDESYELENHLLSFTAFRLQLNEDLEFFKDWSIDKTFLKDQPYTTLKIPKKVLKQMEEDHIKAKAYIDDVIRQINED